MQCGSKYFYPLLQGTLILFAAEKKVFFRNARVQYFCICMLQERKGFASAKLLCTHVYLNRMPFCIVDFGEKAVAWLVA